MEDTVDDSTLDAVDDAIEEREGELVELLADLVAARSVTGEEAPAQDVAVEAFAGLGLDPDVWEPDAGALRGHASFFETSSFVEVGYESRPNVAAVLEGDGGTEDEGRTLTLSGHVDVVSADADAWATDPTPP